MIRTFNLLAMSRDMPFLEEMESYSLLLPSLLERVFRPEIRIRS